MLTGIILSLTAFLVFCAACVLVFHFFPPRRRFSAMMLLSAFSVSVYTFLYFLLRGLGVSAALDSLLPAQVPEIACGLFVYFFIFALYYQLLIIFDSSVTTRIMVELDEAKDKGLSEDDIRRRYSLEDKFRDELKDMDYMRRIVKEGDYYKNTPKGSFHAKVIGFLRDFMHIGGHQ